VVIIDACQSGSEPGDIFKVPGEELEDLPPLTGLHSHSFRWDHALAFARWLLKDEYPQHITVYLIEAQNTDFRMDMSEPVTTAMHKLLDKLVIDLNAEVEHAG
ncbi:MAG: hydrogenase maturation protease, partial [Chloroflexota bacterium]